MHPMSYRWIPIIATFVVMLIGHILSRVTLADYEKRAKKTAEFRDKFIDLANRYMEYHQVDPKLYQECIREVDDIQAELGYDGIVAEFIDPLKNIKMTNMQVLVNVFPIADGQLYNPSSHEPVYSALYRFDGKAYRANIPADRN